jgi:ABC-type histidine transport system ATPase subunit
MFSKNVDIWLRAHDTFLEKPSSGMFIVKRLQIQKKMKDFGNKKTKRSKHDSQNRRRIPLIFFRSVVLEDIVTKYRIFVSNDFLYISFLNRITPI